MSCTLLSVPSKCSLSSSKSQWDRVTPWGAYSGLQGGGSLSRHLGTSRGVGWSAPGKRGPGQGLCVCVYVHMSMSVSLCGVRV